MPIKIELAGAGAAQSMLDILEKEVMGKGLRTVIAKAIVNEVKSHLFRIDRERPNKLGGKRTHFYGDAARSTSFELRGPYIIVSIANVGIAQRYYGGKIAPVTKQWLTIPVHADAHGKRAAELRLFYAVGPAGPFLGFSGRREGGRAVAAYVLRKEVNQVGDKSVIPADETIEKVASEAGREYLNMKLNRAKEAPGKQAARRKGS